MPPLSYLAGKLARLRCLLHRMAIMPPLTYLAGRLSCLHCFTILDGRHAPSVLPDTGRQAVMPTLFTDRVTVMPPLDYLALVGRL